MKQGIYYDISNEDYHNGEGVSKSNLDDIAKCPAIYKWRQKAPEDEEKKKALDIGTALHCLLLEPQHFDERFLVVPPFDRRTTQGKKDLEQFMEENYLPEKIIITEEEERKLRLMQESTLAHPIAKKLLDMDGYCESSIYWVDDKTKVLCKIRPDKLVKNDSKSMIIDVKKTNNIEDFGKSIELYRYHVQDAMYCEGFKKQFGVNPHFVFIAVSETINCGRYPVRVFVLDDYDKEIGYQLFRRDLDKYAECLQTDTWHGFEIIQRPDWARRKDYE